jgi:hypothetical protein
MSWLKIRLKWHFHVGGREGGEGGKKRGKVHTEEINVTFNLFSDKVWFYSSGYTYVLKLTGTGLQKIPCSPQSAITSLTSSAMYYQCNKDHQNHFFLIP